MNTQDYDKQQTEHKIPTFAELQQNSEEAYAYDEFLKLVHTSPPAEWVKDHDQLKIKVRGQWVAYKYLPIDKVEFMLHRIFGANGWKREILREGIMFNAMYVTIRLWYKIPKTNEWLFHDGIGAQGVQVDKGESAANMAAIKSDAIQKGLPSAASYALGNAAEKIGEIFGANLNKIDTQSINAWGGVWNPIYEPEPKSESLGQLADVKTNVPPKTMEAKYENIKTDNKTVSETTGFVLEY